jgi:hypothetical protein
MREQYIMNKVSSLFHGEHRDSAEKLFTQAKMARIMNLMHAEIQRDMEELSNKLTRMLHLCLKENSGLSRVEIALKLPPESLHGKIDLTPKSNQDK